LRGGGGEKSGKWVRGGVGEVACGMGGNWWEVRGKGEGCGKFWRRWEEKVEKGVESERGWEAV